jgi:hypothetical protein
MIQYLFVILLSIDYSLQPDYTFNALHKQSGFTVASLWDLVF